MEDVSSDVGEGSGNSKSVWVRGKGLARSKEASFGTWKGGSPFLMGGAAELATSWGEGGFPALLLPLPPEPEPLAACA